MAKDRADDKAPKTKPADAPPDVDGKLVEAAANLVHERITPGLKELELRVAGLIHQLDQKIDKNAQLSADTLDKLANDQDAMNQALSELSETYSDVRAVVSTDWREYAGEDFVAAEAESLEMSHARKEAMKKLTKHERDVPAEKLNVDPKYAQLKAAANAAADKHVAAKRKVTELKNAAMLAIAG